MKYRDMPEGCGANRAYDYLVHQAALGRHVALIPGTSTDGKRALFLYSAVLTGQDTPANRFRRLIQVAIKGRELAEAKGVDFHAPKC